MSDQLLIVFHSGKVYSYSGTRQETSSYFGGPISGKLSGIPHGPALPHQVAKLDRADLPLPKGESELSDLVLIYGFRFDGCELEYEIGSGCEIKIVASVQRESSDDWPYQDYPHEFPKVFLELTGTRAMAYEDFSSEWPNLPRLQPAEIVVLVPPPSTLGVSLWGEDGDAEGVTVVFECDPVKRKVRTYNICS
ncbi:hypothetical protein [Cupriavidus sp. a3]|uniref:hypothetical protein n=1 Tax=Cupriavidus sp. a3 TaxID=3242158 RepID=UPI003D9C3DB8